MEIALRMPDLGTVDDTIKVVKWLVEVGQPVQRGQPVVEVETDKSILEVESAVTGTLQAIEVNAGGEAASGQVLATVAVAADGEQPSDAVPREALKTAVKSVESAPEPARPAPTRAVTAGSRVSFFEKNRQTHARTSPVTTGAGYNA